MGWEKRGRAEEEKEDGQSKLLIKAQLRKSPCQEHSLTASCPKEPVEELPSELEASTSLLQLAIAINNMQVIVQRGRIITWSKSFQILVLDGE